MGEYEGVGLACGSFRSRDVGERIFGGKNTVQTQMTVEAALAKAQAALGVIPEPAAEEIGKKCSVELLSEEEYFAQLAKTGHPLMGMIRAYAAICDNGAGQYIHYGTTTQDVADTARMLQLKQAWEVIYDKTVKLRGMLAAKARQYKDLIVMGRTNDQQAMPVTLGFRIANWADELNRSAERMEQAKDRIFVGQFFGAVGTLASLEKDGMAIQKLLFEEVDLGTPDIMWSCSRDRLAELTSDLAILCNTLGRIANEVYLEQKSEVNELAEGFQMGKVGSSTMPHKRNPFIPGRIVGYSRLARATVMDALASMEASSGRDVRCLYMEDEYLARICCLTDAALDQMIVLMDGLEVHENSIQRNLDLLGGLVYAEALMMRLSPVHGRLEAHELIYELAQRSISDNQNFRELLLADPRITEHLTAEDLDDIMDPAHYIGLAAEFAENVAAKYLN